MECTLVMFKSDGTRRDIPLVGARSVVGRMSTCEVRIPLNSVSREHCELVCDGDVLRYKDLNSSNGVVHNGAKSKSGILKAGDELVVGPVIFTVMIDGKPTKIRPIRTILDEADDRKVAKEEAEARAGIKVVGASGADTRAATVLAAEAVSAKKPPSATPPAPVQDDIDIPDAQEIETLSGDSDFAEFNPSPAKPAKSGAPVVMAAMPGPIGEDDGDATLPAAPLVKLAAKAQAPKPAPAKEAKDELAPAADAEEFEFVDEHEGDDEEPAFTFD